MTHPDEDTLLRHALRITGTAEAVDSRDVAGHIASCPECSRTMREMTADIALISGTGAGPGARPGSGSRGDSAPGDAGEVPAVPPLPLLRYPSIRTAFRAAAVVAVILLGGYLTSGPGAGRRAAVVPQRFTPPPVTVPAGDFSSCEVIDISSL